MMSKYYWSWCKNRCKTKKHKSIFENIFEVIGGFYDYRSDEYNNETMCAHDVKHAIELNTFRVITFRSLHCILLNRSTNRVKVPKFDKLRMFLIKLPKYILIKLPKYFLMSTTNLFTPSKI